MKDNRVLDVLFDDEGTEPVTLADVKAQARIETDDEDALLNSYITAARQMIEGYLNVSLVERVVTANLLNELGDIYLPYGPIGEITSFVQDHAPEDKIDADIYKLRGQQFKRISTAFDDSITVTYTVGYATVPQYLKVAVLQQVAFMYENRGDVEKVLSPDVKNSLAQYRRVL